VDHITKWPRTAYVFSGDGDCVKSYSSMLVERSGRSGGLESIRIVEVPEGSKAANASQSACVSV